MTDNVLQPPAGCTLHSGREIICFWDRTGWYLKTKGLKTVQLPRINNPGIIDTYPVFDEQKCVTPFSPDTLAQIVLSTVRNHNPTCKVRLPDFVINPQQEF